MVLYGKNSVVERLKTNPESIKKIFLQDTFENPDITALIKSKHSPVERMSGKRLKRIKNSENLQGIVALVNKFDYTSLDEILLLPLEQKLTILFLDRIYDPHNLGSIIRTVACLGGFAVVIPKFNACEVNETVLHVSSGAETHVMISMVSNISNAIIAAKKCGYWIMGAMVTDNAESIRDLTIPFPLGLVLGSEWKGIRQGIQKHLDIRARIPMGGASLSFNVTMACAILCYEIAGRYVRQD